METVLLTGATGFLGSHLLEWLLRENYNVLIIKRSFSNTWRIKHILPEVKFYNIDKVPLEKAFKENKIDVVIHTATTYGRKGESYSEIIESNLLLPINLIELSILYNVTGFFNTDSFFNTDNLKYKYLNYYSLSKKQLIDWLRLLSDKIQVVNLKLEHLYGPKDNKDKFIMWLIQEFLENAPEIKLTRGEQKRDFIYISDVVNAFRLTLKKRKLLSNYSEFEVGTGEDISIRDFVIKVKSIVADVSGKEVNTILNFGAIPYREGEFMVSVANNITLKQLGWDCSVSLEDGLKRTISTLLNKERAKNE